MQSETLRGATKLLMASSLLFFATGCAATNPVVMSALRCDRLIPREWKEPIEAAPLTSATVGGLGAALDGTTARLDQSNDRTRATIEIVTTCEDAKAEAVTEARRATTWRRFLPKIG